MKQTWLLACAATAVMMVLCVGPNALASSIKVVWADAYQDKELTIETDVQPLFRGMLTGDSLVIKADEMLGSATRKSATVSVKDQDQLTIGINLFRCDPDCDWPIAFAAWEPPNSMSINKTCLATHSTMARVYERYFFCRSAYQTFAAASGNCWPEALSALTGWFDAAYKLHEKTLRDGIGFVARDEEVEKTIDTTMEACPGFEKAVHRNPGYFSAMKRNLDVAILRQAQRVERSLAARQDSEARILASAMVEELDRVPPLRAYVPEQDVRYVEGVVNRALPEARFRLQ